MSTVGDTPSTSNVPTRATGERLRLGELLVSDGLITTVQLAHALSEQKRLKLPLGRTLVKLNYLSDGVMRRALSRQVGVPYIELENLPVDLGLAKLVSRAVARQYAIVPVSRAGETLTIAVFDLRVPRSLATELGRLTAHTIKLVTASTEAIQRRFAELYDARPASPATERSAGEASRHTLKVTGPESTVAPGTSDSSIGADELFGRIMSAALKYRCSDIHIEMLAGGLRIRFRIDGVLREPDFGAAQQIFDKNMREIVSRIKILSKLDIAERRRPQDGSFQMSVERGAQTVTVDLRISVLPSYSGESVVIRVLDRTRAPKTLSQLDLSPEVMERLDAVLKRTTGIFLVTGPTGSGKSTTLYSCLMHLYKPEIRILTAEDPVEYVYEHLSQSEVNEEIGNTFAKYLRSFLRHDPEVILVGEIRDQETAEMAFRAAQTGHLLLSTLHTNSAIATLPRLLDLNIDPSLIASSLIGVMSQRLVRRLCSACKQQHEPAEDLVKEFFGDAQPDVTFYKPVGCDRCGRNGYDGRMLLVDLWIPDDRDLLLITRQAPWDEIRASAQLTTFSMAEDTNLRLQKGQTTLEELARVVPYPVIAEHRARYA